MNKPIQRGIATARRYVVPKAIEIGVPLISLLLLLCSRCGEQNFGASPAELGNDEAWPLTGVKCYRGAGTARKDTGQNGRAKTEEIEKFGGQKAGEAEFNYAPQALPLEQRSIRTQRAKSMCDSESHEALFLRDGGIPNCDSGQRIVLP